MGDDRTIALVTGASRGIGRATALRLAEAGLDVAINYLGATDEEAAAARETVARAESHGARAVAIEADVSDRAAVARMVATAEAQLGAIDVLVTNAGVEVPAALEEIRDADWARMIAVNLTGQLLPIQAVAGGMRARRRGRIVTVASELALIGRAGLAGYCASKAGVIGLTKAAARELAPDGVLVNCVAPGPTATDMLPPQERTPAMVARIPLGRIGTPEEIAEVIRFLASPANTWMTGQVVSPNGGVVI